jgi:hypothetical protein
MQKKKTFREKREKEKLETIRQTHRCNNTTLYRNRIRTNSRSERERKIEREREKIS